ncbi:nucleotidyl transferase AbiEii/AbiGii toxin family protein [Solwaraspora sp. WMMB335]|uniref:nucleotidyl transferase AbiEii/AbiGii toxin family protein n=1 Tax=Solwaraspora sp. WMMB335 TaxID=3404118 RepID=UPI003B96462B
MRSERTVHQDSGGDRPDVPMGRQLSAAAAVQRLCGERGWRSCLVGGLAVLRWGRPRPTEDVDLLVEAGHGVAGEMAQALFGCFEPRSADAHRFAVDHRIAQLWAGERVAVDVALGTSRRLRRTMDRASWWESTGPRLLTCSAEDLIVNKAISDRERDWHDVAGIVERQGARLDRELILREFGPVRTQGHHLGDPLAQLNDHGDGAAVARLRQALTTTDRLVVDHG